MNVLIPTTGRYQPEEEKKEEEEVPDEEDSDSDGTSRASIFSKSEDEMIRTNNPEKRRKA